MRRSARVTLSRIGVLLFLAAPGGGQAQVLAKTLIFNSVQPCRVADTRIATAGILLGGAPRTFHVVGATTNYSSQGGVAGGCGIPGFVNGLPQVQAVAVNIVAVDPSGDGFLTAWPTDQAFPPASTVNFQKLVPNLNIANGVIVPVRQDTPGGDITIVAGVSNAHAIVDITGYFSKAEPRKYYLTTGGFDGSQALTACAAGYHMASLGEIFDTSNLSYNTGLGLARADSGAGPPSEAGWIRTGDIASTSTVPGRGNCTAWTAVTGSGTYVVPYTTPTLSGWATAATIVSPWVAFTAICDAAPRVWCVEN